MATTLPPGSVGWVHGYCETTRCAVREVSVHVKLYDEAHAFTATTGWRCPRCGQPLGHVRYRTMEEQEAEDERVARCSVNVQRYRRDHQQTGPWVAIPATVLLDDTLP